MTKITGNIQDYMIGSLKGLFERVIAARPCPIDANTLHDLCTTREDRALMTRAFSLSGHNKGQIYSAQQADVSTKDLTIGAIPQAAVDRGVITLNLNYPRGIKQYPIRGFDPTLALPEVIQPFMDWLQWRIEYGMAFATADSLINMFADKGASLEQMRYALPGTLTICSTHESLAHLVPRIERFRAPARPFPLSTEVLQHVKTVNEVLAVAALMPESNVNHSVSLQSLEIPNYVVMVK